MTMVREKPAVNEQIKDLNLISLRKYACPKIQSQNDWYLQCVECLGREGCPAGKRAIEIIENETKPEPKQKTQVQKFNDRLKKTLDAARSNVRSKKFVDAFEKGGDDPAGYLYSLGGYATKWRARDALKKWMNSHGLTLDDAEILKGDFHKNANKANSKKAADSRTLKARKNIEKLFEGLTTKEEKIRAILDHEEKETNTGHTLRNRMCNWKTKYPDLFEKYDLNDIYRTFTMKSMQKLTIAGLRIELLHEPVVKKKPEPEPEEDEVSIEDFLAENDEDPFETGDEEETLKAAEPVSITDQLDNIWKTVKEEREDIAKQEPAEDELTEEKLNSLVDYSTNYLVREQFASKLNTLQTEYKNATEQVNKWTEWKNKIHKDMETLYSAMDILGLGTEEEDDDD